MGLREFIIGTRQVVSGSYSSLFIYVYANSEDFLPNKQRQIKSTKDFHILIFYIRWIIFS